MKRFTQAEIAEVAAVYAGSITCVKAVSETAKRVHVGLAEGSFNTYPFCGVLTGRDTETTDELANCPDCKRLMRLAGHDLYNLFEGIDENYDPEGDRFSASYFPDRDA